MIDYIGDVSKNDALVLRKLAEKSVNVLEFGSGASTQILRAYSSGTVTSVEVSPKWIASTQGHLTRLGLGSVSFVPYSQFTPSGPYDLVFNDGPLELRAAFAEMVWKHVEIGGMLLYHDTRTTNVVLNVATLFKDHSPEIHTMVVNQDHSNITVVYKKIAEYYEDWNLIEGKEEWQVGR